MNQGTLAPARLTLTARPGGFKKRKKKKCQEGDEWGTETEKRILGALERDIRKGLSKKDVLAEI